MTGHCHTAAWEMCISSAEQVKGCPEASFLWSSALHFPLPLVARGGPEGTQEESGRQLVAKHLRASHTYTVQSHTGKFKSDYGMPGLPGSRERHLQAVTKCQCFHLQVGTARKHPSDLSFQIPKTLALPPPIFFFNPESFFTELPQWLQGPAAPPV